MSAHLRFWLSQGSGRTCDVQEHTRKWKMFIPITLVEKRKRITLNFETTLETIQPVKVECVTMLQK